MRSFCYTAGVELEFFAIPRVNSTCRRLEEQADRNAGETLLSTTHSGRIRLALVTLLGEHRAMIRMYAYAITGDSSLVEDIYQEVSLAIVHHWDELPTGEGVVPWLKETTRRRSLEALRRFRSRRLVLDEATLARVEAALPSAPEGRDVSAARREILSRCVEKLADDARSVVTERYWGNLSCDEIARKTGRTVKSVYGILARTRLALADCVRRAGRAAEQGV